MKKILGVYFRGTNQKPDLMISFISLIIIKFLLILGKI